ncbi:MAG: NnrS family protein [Halofilum sp. (in: g-proteobacteria)]|nr:NnrS family protein [Halofilum sp. (in: g-proteobacteria)]
MQRTAHRVPTLLLAGFRPFFLLGAVAAIVVMLRTVLVFSGAAASPAAGPVSWHGHEMLFGFVAATAAGFLLTAVPNWTGTAPVAGLPLALLAALWLAARAGLWGGDPAAWAIAADVAFLPAIALVATWPAWRQWRPRAWLPLGVVLVLGGVNASWHLGAALALPALGDRAVTVATMLIALLIAVIGGRITPAFTRNRMLAAGAGPPPRAGDARDGAALAASVLAVLAALAWPAATAPAAGAAALLHGLRLWGWRGGWTLRDPLLFVLHLGYAWLAAGYALHALAPFVGGGGAWGLHGLLAGRRHDDAGRDGPRHARPHRPPAACGRGALGRVRRGPAGRAGSPGRPLGGDHGVDARRHPLVRRVRVVPAALRPDAAAPARGVSGGRAPRGG